MVATLALATPARAFDPASALSLNHTLAADSFEGRFSGLSSGRKVEDFVAARFEDWGLTPAGAAGTYFAPFEMLVTQEQSALLELKDTPFGNLRFVYGDDYHLCTNSGSADVTAEVILVGHGLSSPDREWDDYADLDIRGKIALILRGTPDNGHDWGEAGSRDSTLAEAVRRGAVGVIFVQGRPVQGAAVHVLYPKVPCVYADERVLEHLLMNTGWDLKRYKDALEEKPTRLVPDKRIRMRTRVRVLEDGRARNVVGLLEGTDPALKHELILVGGHMDHVGRNGDGIIFNGANDNGSGTSVVLELARSFAALPERPKRTLVFLTFAAEEQGLLGSEAFAAKPTVPLDSAVAMLNFDMTGHGNGKAYLGGGEHYPEIRAAFTASLDSARADSVLIRRGWRGNSSDHGPFLQLGIPTMNLGSDGDHRFYHSLQDDPGWISEAALGAVGRTAQDWILMLANHETPLLAEHRNGRTLLYASDQVDFAPRPPVPNAPATPLPVWVRGSFHWTPAVEFATPAWLDSLAALRRAADADGHALVRTLKAVRDASRTGTRAVLLGLRSATAGEGVGVPPARRPLLESLDVAALAWDGGAPEDSTVLAEIAKAGVFFLVPPDGEQLAKLPKDAKRCIRFFPAVGERVPEPSAQPRKLTLFVAAWDGEGDMTAGQLAALIRSMGVDRTHLDLVPWLRTADEAKVAAFLEELYAVSGWTHAQMTALLGGNLARL